MMNGKKRIFKPCHIDKLGSDHGPLFQNHEFKAILGVNNAGLQ
jgi:hypothetical protein